MGNLASEKQGLQSMMYWVGLAAGMIFNEIIHNFPELTIDDIKACLAFAADRERKLKHVS